MASFQLPIDKIEIQAKRQRTNLGDTNSLATSLASVGQLQPIVVSAETSPSGEVRYILVAGERRLEAAKSLNWTHIEAIEKANLDSHMRHKIELEENIRRKDLTWQEMVQAYAELAELSTQPMNKIAEEYGLSYSSFTSIVKLAAAMKTDKSLHSADTWRRAYDLFLAKNAKALSVITENIFAQKDIFKVTQQSAENISALKEEDIISDEEEGALPELPPFTLPEGTSFPVEAISIKSANLLSLYRSLAEAKSTGTSIDATSIEAALSTSEALARQQPFYTEQADFAIWAKNYTGRRYNFIHVDFPYGIGIDKNALQNSAAKWDNPDERYEDSPETFNRLTKAFFDHQEGFIASLAHCIFWVSNKNFGAISARFRFFGWNVCDTGLIWHKGNGFGIAPDPIRWPRRSYEIAIFASRGDRKINTIKTASFAGPASEKQFHMAEKSPEMLRHFFEMVVDGTTEIFDPSIGSGNSLLVAKTLGAKSGYGLDIEAKYVNAANARLKT